MKKNFLALGVVATLFLNACKETPKQDQAETSTTEVVDNTQDDIVETSSTNDEGQTLQLKFNNSEGTVTLNFKGDMVTLTQEKAASGIWYKNENYELRGKGNDLELTKAGDVIFKHEDNIVAYSIKNKDGETLDMTFNNSTNKVKLYVNGGEQIELDAEKAASGIWYKNSQYELRGKGENLTLTKDGKVVFEN
ncbi:MliC family protein [Bizionia hallyeonensis]|uniref:MliC family protein n=1 Tax=Bizionia hallyeonensis TaxID=1123757 RepID=A0ABW0C407_9FLAO